MGAGLAKKIAAKWPMVKEEYLQYCKYLFMEGFFVAIDDMFHYFMLTQTLRNTKLLLVKLCTTIMPQNCRPTKENTGNIHESMIHVFDCETSWCQIMCSARRDCNADETIGQFAACHISLLTST